MSISVNDANSEISNQVRRFLLEFNGVNTFVQRMNQLLDDTEGNLKLVNRRDDSKIVSSFRISSGQGKVVVRYETGITGTMMVKNVARNIRFIEIDVWDEMDEDKEQDFLMERLGIR